MTKTRDINSREDAVTKDMQPATERETSFTIPSLGISVQAKSLNEALEKAKELVRARQEEFNNDDN